MSSSRFWALVVIVTEYRWEREYANDLALDKEEEERMYEEVGC
jgi:hypothetical protein